VDLDLEIMFLSDKDSTKVKSRTIAHHHHGAGLKEEEIPVVQICGTVIDLPCLLQCQTMFKNQAIAPPRLAWGETQAVASRQASQRGSTAKD